jgi:4-deoxy-L-threo-5-hexosulose-uronate ketol-isomerase
MKERAMETRHLVDPVRYRQMTGAELRQSFLVEDLFAPDEVRLLHWEAERTIIGSVVPATRALALPNPPEIKAPFFAARRELGIVNLGGAGTVSVDDASHALGHRDILYVGQGAQEIAFASAQPSSPALFYLVSHPAHASHPTTLATAEGAQTIPIGDTAHASERVLRRYVHEKGVRSCQLVMGVTDIRAGSVWNTLPPHTHVRRTEIYLYFDLQEAERVVHLMGPPEDTRHLVVANRQAVLSPPWSIHFGAGTSRYAFVWSMGGENQEFEDMQVLTLDRLR